MKTKGLTWDDAMAALAHQLAHAPVAERTRIWNTLQQRASTAAGIDRPGRMPWPQAFLHLTPDDVLDVVTG